MRVLYQKRSFCCEIKQIWDLYSFLYAEILGIMDTAVLGSYIVISSWDPGDPGSSFFFDGIMEILDPKLLFGPWILEILDPG